MPEWLADAFPSNVQIPWGTLTTRLAVAFVLGGGVAIIYWLTQRGQKTFAPGFLTTLVLLSILISMVTQVIGDNQARAFSLVGALAIIRFRTTVEDTRDSAFVISSVAVGMAIGGGHLAVALVGLFFIAVAALTLMPLVPPSVARPNGAQHLLTLRLGLGADPDALLQDVFHKYLAHFRFISSGTARQGAALDVTYRVNLNRDEDAVPLVRDLNRLEGVQSVDLRGE